MHKLKPLDFVILISILATSLFFIIKPAFPKGNKILVEADGVSYQYSLSTNQTLDFQGPLGITKVQIQEGKVKITDSPCPNKNCISQGYSNPIVCLPNRIVIKIEEEGGFDAVAE